MSTLTMIGNRVAAALERIATALEAQARITQADDKASANESAYNGPTYRG